MTIRLSRQFGQQQGLGLLELMLVMIVATTVIMLSVQYFGSGKRNTLVNNAVAEIQAMVSAAANIPDLAGMRDNSPTTLTNAIAMSGQIPAIYIHKNGVDYDIATPWAEVTDVDGTKSVSSTFTAHVASVETTTSPLKLVIQSTGLPNWGCQSIVNKYQGIALVADCRDPHRDDNDHTLTKLNLEFPLQMVDF